MSLKTGIEDELKRSPIAAISGAVGVAIAALSLMLAWIQYRTTPSTVYPLPPTTTPSPPEFLLGNVLLVVAYFLAVTIAATLLLKTIARKHEVTAFLASIPLIALTNFSSILVMYLAPPRPLSTQFLGSAHDLVFYASAAIVIAFCGRAFLADMVTGGGRKTTDTETKSGTEGLDGAGVLLMTLIVLGLWSWLVFAGQTRLTRTLLPEVAHPVEVKPLKSGS